MKKITLFSLLFCGIALGVRAQTLQEYFNLFPTIAQDVNWTGDDLENARKNIPIIEENYLKFIDNDGKEVSTYKNTIPLGKIQIGTTTVVFFAKHFNYRENYDTQISLHGRAYDKNGELLPMGIYNYLASTGGDAATQKFMYSFSFTLNWATQTILIEQKSTDKAMESTTLYKISKKGLVSQ
ncbi:MAG: hypothetical protein EAZ55_02575 [Cytophagales bacterium]|nr:MAG: hypothetical protein EAZ55_02575 [Cytophagales bacterium]